MVLGYIRKERNHNLQLCKNNSVTATPIVSFNFRTNDWDWLNQLSPDVLNTVTRRGVSFERAQKLNDDIKNRIKTEI